MGAYRAWGQDSLYGDSEFQAFKCCMAFGRQRKSDDAGIVTPGQSSEMPTANVRPRVAATSRRFGKVQKEATTSMQITCSPN